VKRRTIVGAVAMLMIATPIFPCGGPGADIVDRPIVPVHDYLGRLVHGDDEYEMTLRQELRFLEPFNVAMPDSVAAVYEWTYMTGVGRYTFEEPSDSVLRANEVKLLTPANEALARGALADAGAAARRVVSAVLDCLPASHRTTRLRCAPPTNWSTSRLDWPREIKPRQYATSRRMMRSETASRGQAA
jgi:hypothetical protein